MTKLGSLILFTTVLTFQMTGISCTGEDPKTPEDSGATSEDVAPRQPLRLREISPEDSTAAEERLKAGAMHQIAGKIDSAEVEYLAALELAPGHLATSLRYGKMLVATDRLAEAIDCLETAVSYYPDSLDVRMTLARYLERYDEPDLAMKHYRAVVAIDSTHGEAHYRIAKALFEASDFEGALALFRRHAELVPESGIGPVNAGVILAQTGRLPEAIVEFRTAVEREPKSYDAHMYLARALTEAGQAADALPHYLAATQAEPGRVEPFIQMGLHNLEIGKLEEAEKMFELVLTQAPGNLVAMVRMAQSLDQQGKYREAKDMLEKVLEIDPTNRVAQRRIPILNGLLADSTSADSLQ